MTYIAIAVGLAVSALCAWSRRRQTGAEPDPAAGLLRTAGTALMFALCVAAIDAQALPAATVAALAGAATGLDVRSVLRPLVGRRPGRQASTVTPFQNAT